MAPDGSEPSLAAAQLERLQLENEKLRLELAALRRVRPWYHLPVQIVPIVTALLAIAGFSWGIIQYRHEQAKNRHEQQSQSASQRVVAEREFMKPWLESQRAIYTRALVAAATVANTNDAKRRTQATEEFWRLYQGEMILVETKSVSGKMVDFGNCLTMKDVCDRKEMNRRCKELATAMATSMAATAGMKFEEFSANQFKYGSR